jgi:hypothetical protein
MTELIKSTYVNQSDQLDLDQLSRKESYISNLSPSSAHWRAMLRHPHAKRFRKLHRWSMKRLKIETLDKSSIALRVKIIK